MEMGSIINKYGIPLGYEYNINGVLCNGFSCAQYFIDQLIMKGIDIEIIFDMVLINNDDQDIKNNWIPLNQFMNRTKIHRN